MKKLKNIALALAFILTLKVGVQATLHHYKVPGTCSILSKITSVHAQDPNDPNHGQTYPPPDLPDPCYQCPWYTCIFWIC